MVVTVDGLNAISGLPDTDVGRMYVLGPWDQTTVRGWRTSLSDVRRFTFVDEGASYAARAGKANSKMGWIEIAVYRERRAYVQRRPWLKDGSGSSRDGDEPRPAEVPPSSPSGADAASPAAKAAPEAERPSEQALDARRHAPSPSYPGTGWGPQADDPVVLVNFNPESSPCQRLTIRYEYASALRALGILPWSPYRADRLRERERGEDGFARPPIF